MRIFPIITKIIDRYRVFKKKRSRSFLFRGWKKYFGLKFLIIFTTFCYINRINFVYMSILIKWLITFPSTWCWIRHIVKFDIHCSYFWKIRHTGSTVDFIEGIFCFLVDADSGSIYIVFWGKVHDDFFTLEKENSRERFYLQLAAIITRYFFRGATSRSVSARKWWTVKNRFQLNLNR